MKTPVVIALAVAVVLGAGSGLAAMNHACKTGQHAWCAPSSTLKHHVKARGVSRDEALLGAALSALNEVSAGSFLSTPMEWPLSILS
jgi:hypothetical protein